MAANDGSLIHLNLLALPPEIRLQIYSSLFNNAVIEFHFNRVPSTEDSALAPGNSSEADPLRRFIFPAIVRQLQLTCRQLCSEVKASIFSYAMFDFATYRNKEKHIKLCEQPSQMLAAISRATCRPHLVPTLLRSKGNFSDLRMANDMEQKLTISLGPERATRELNIALLKEVVLVDDLGLLYAITQPEEYGKAYIFDAQAKARHFHRGMPHTGIIRLLEQLNDTIKALRQSEHSYNVKIRLRSGKAMLKDREIEITRSSTGPVSNYEIRDQGVIVRGIDVRWYSIAEKRIKAALRLYPLTTFAFENTRRQDRKVEIKKYYHNSSVLHDLWRRGIHVRNEDDYYGWNPN